MKRIKQWFIGLIFASFGYVIINSVIGVICFFIDMMNTVGKEFVINFFMFLLFLVLSLTCPYILFMEVKDGVKDKYK